MNSIQVLEPTNNLHASETGLEITGEPTEDEWTEMGTKLARADKPLQWIIGDWYNNIPWGDKKEACEEVGLRYKSARNYASVCNAFPEMSSREDNCGFRIHEATTSLPTPEERKEVLDLAAVEGWSVKDMREEVKSRKPKLPPKPVKKKFSPVEVLYELGIIPSPKSGGNTVRTYEGMAEINPIFADPHKRQLIENEEEFRKVALAVSIKKDPDFAKNLEEKIKKQEEEIKAKVEELPKTKKKQFENIVDSASNLMNQELELERKKVIDEANAKVRVEVEETKKAKAEAFEFRRKAKDNYGKSAAKLASVDSFMTEKEYKLVLGCLHPDKEASSERKAKAFEIFNRLQEHINPKLPVAERRRRGWA